MYNESQKQEFITYFTQQLATKSAGTFYTVFNKAAPYEELYQKDIADMSYSELKVIFNRIVSLSYSNRKLTQWAVKSYISWAIEKGLSMNTENVMNLISADSSLLFSDNIIYSPKELVDICDELFDDIAEQTLNLIPRCVLYLEYMGFKIKDISKIKNDDLDILQHAVCGVKIYDEFYPALLTMQGVDSYIKKQARGTRIMKVNNSENFIKLHHFSLAQEVSCRMNKVKQVNPYLNITQYSVYYSGLLYAAYLEEKKSGNINKILKKVKPKSDFKNDFESYKEIISKR